MARKGKIAKTAEQLEAERILARANELLAVNIQPEAALLQRQQDIAITRAGERREGQKVKEDSARRLDAFEALKAGMAPGCYDACRRFELDILLRRGEADRGQSTQRVDKTAGLITDAMVDAALRVEAVVERLPPHTWWLLMELISPTVDRGTWHETVAFVTGEETAPRQREAVKLAAVHLRDAYVAVETKKAA